MRPLCLIVAPGRQFRVSPDCVSCQTVAHGIAIREQVQATPSELKHHQFREVRMQHRQVLRAEICVKLGQTKTRLARHALQKVDRPCAEESPVLVSDCEVNEIFTEMLQIADSASFTQRISRATRIARGRTLRPMLSLRIKW